MYQTLWNSINKQVKNSHAYAAFLAVSLMGWKRSVFWQDF